MFWKKKDEKFETTVGKESMEKDLSGEKAKAEKPAKEKTDTTPLKKDEMTLLYESTVKDIKEGQIVKGKIIEIRNKDVVVDIGYKSEGIISISEFSDRSKLKLGDEIEVYLDSKEDEHGCVVISKQKADKLQGWERIISTSKEGDVIKGRPSRKVKGGLMVDIGMEAFLPASLASLKNYSNLDELIGQELEFKIVKINRPRKNIVLSRKEVLQQRAEESKQKLLSVLEKGHVVNGVVKNITDFGAFIDLGGLDGLLHITDMSWGRISHPSEMLAIGDKIEVVILDFNKETNRVSLGLKQKSANPWKEVDAKYPVGSKVKGKVVNIMPYGAFIEIEKGIEGLVHISELSWTKKYSHPNELLAIGDVIETVVLDIDKDNQKISLGIKQLEAD
ncbi:MAG: S1 RNA-binding domain-containing protein, partial [Candidatus Omnitrophica bacterium]|nr:S1 RNA-binding domain-containing protein [Candidatus Omnitrophota bacterium]